MANRIILEKAIRLPPKPVGNTLVPKGTPLHATHIFLALMRQYFSDMPNDHPFHYDANSFEKSGILFDTVYNKDAEAFGKKPLIVVSRGTQTANCIMQRDLGAMSMVTGNSMGSNLVTSSIQARVISRVPGEVDLLSQYVFGFCLMNRVLLSRLLGIHMVDTITLSDASRMDKDDDEYVASVSISYSMQYIWSRLAPERDPLLGIDMHVLSKKPDFEREIIVPEQKDTEDGTDTPEESEPV